MATNCTLPVIAFGSLCAMCGKDLQGELREADFRSNYATTKDHVKHSVLMDLPSIQAQTDELSQQLLRSKKLFLVLDLDLTMLHAVSARKDPAVAQHFMGGPGYDTSLGPFAVKGATPVPVAHDMYCFVIRGDTIVVKLRPGWSEFLRTLFDIFQLHIYTMGTREYAAAIVKILDPTGTLFSGQVFSRDDFPHAISGTHEELDFKNMSWLFPTDAVKNLAVVVDDNLGVWRGFTSHVVQIDPYIYFRNTREVNALSVLHAQQHAAVSAAMHATLSVSSGATGGDGSHGVSFINPHRDDSLQVVQRVLQRLHEKFFGSAQPPTVQVVLGQLRREVFGRTKELPQVQLVFAQARPEPYSNVADTFGASCRTQLTDHTTAVIAARPAGPVVEEAFRRGVPVVRPEWITYCTMRWERAEFGAFRIDPSAALLPPTPAGAAAQRPHPFPFSPRGKLADADRAEALVEAAVLGELPPSGGPAGGQLDEPLGRTEPGPLVQTPDGDTQTTTAVAVNAAAAETAVAASDGAMDVMFTAPAADRTLGKRSSSASETAAHADAAAASAADVEDVDGNDDDSDGADSTASSGSDSDSDSGEEEEGTTVSETAQVKRRRKRLRLDAMAEWMLDSMQQQQ